MKSHMVVFSLAAAAVLAAVAAPSATFGVRAGSYNIRCIASADTDDKSWDARKASLASLVTKIGYDVVGFQEVKAAQKTYFDDNLPGYTLYHGQPTSNADSAESMSIAYKTDIFDRLDGGTFWLSDTPDKCSKLPASQYNRLCTWVLLRRKGSTGKLLFANTHLDLVKDVRPAQMKVIIDYLNRKYTGDGISTIIVGDMNEYEKDIAITEATKVFKDSAVVAKSVSGPWRTYDAWTYIDPASEPTAQDTLALPVSSRNPLKFGGRDHKRIDFILVSRQIGVESYVVRNDTQPGKEQYPSDHYPVYADLELPVAVLGARGRVSVEISADCPRAAAGTRFVLTQGAGLENDENLDFILPGWVKRATVEDGEIVIYTTNDPFVINIR